LPLTVTEALAPFALIARYGIVIDDYRQKR